MLYIGVLNTDGLIPSDNLLENLPENVRERILTTKNENEKRLRAGAYMLLSKVYKLYAEEKGISVEMPGICYTGDGKPCFCANDSLQNTPKFNISHDTQLSVVAISDEGEIGVDVQSLPQRRVNIEKIAERFLAPLRRLDVQFSRGEATGEIIFDEPLVKFFFYKIKNGCLELTPEDTLSKGDITRNEAEGDFLAKWTLLEAILKASGGGFGEASSVGALSLGARSKTVTLSLSKRKYALTVAVLLAGRESN